MGMNSITIYLIKKPPRVELVWQESSPLERVGPCWFDGKYVWCAIDHRTDKPRLLLIDPQQAKVQEFRPPRPLPTHSDQGSGQFQITPSLLGAPLTPGRVLLAGHMGRSWIGIGAVSSSGDHQLEIVYEARTAEVRDRHAKQDAETVFLPLAMFPLLSAATAKKDVLIVRGSPTVLGLEYELPLIFRGDTAKVEPAPPHWNMSGFRGLTTHADQLVFLIYDFQPDPVRIPFFVCGKEPTSRRKLADDVPWGVFVWHEGMLHVVGERWWVWNPVTGKRRELVGEVPFRSERMPSRQRVNASLQSPSEYDWHVNNITSTHHYSVVVTTRNAVLFSAQFPTLGGE
jgi:hypothetical protein